MRGVVQSRASTLLPELVVGGLATVAFLVWSVDGGGAAPTSLYPGSLFLLGLLCVATLVYSRAPGWRLPSRPLVLACLLLAGFVAWNFASIAWADVKGDAWLASNRALTYLIVFVLFALPPWRRTSAAIVLGAYAVGVAAVAGGTLLHISTAAEPELSFIGDALVDPTGYHNATAALFLAAFFPAIFLASRLEVAWPLRGLLLAAAGLLLQVALIAQSRGSAIAFAITLLLYLVLVPGRLRAALHLVAVALAVVPAVPTLLDVYTTLRDGGDAIVAIDQASRAVYLTCGALLLAGCLLGLVDRRLEIPPRVGATAERGFAVVAAVVALAGLVLAINATGDPLDWVDARWEDFKSGYGEDDFGSSRFSGGLGSNRYDFWRVSWQQFTERPLTGAGSESFAVDYLRERSSDEEPKHPHSLPLRVLGQTGLVGSLLLAGFALSAVYAALRRSSRRDRLGSGLAVASLAAVAYWFVHASGDWHWVFPSLTAPAFALLALAGRVSDAEGQDNPEPAQATTSNPDAAPETSTQPPPRQNRRMPLTVATAACFALFAAASYLLPLGAAEDVSAAASSWRHDPNAAFERLERARQLNFLSAEPDLVAGTIAVELRDYDRAQEAFSAALTRDPHNWYAQLSLGALKAQAGARSSALRHLQQARALNPRDPLIARVLHKARGGHSVDLRAVNRALLNRVCMRVGETRATRFCR